MLSKGANTLHPMFDRGSENNDIRSNVWGWWYAHTTLLTKKSQVNHNVY